MIIRQILNDKTCLTYSLFLYVFLISFTRLWYLPFFRAKIQPTELLFIFISIIALKKYGWHLLLPKSLTLPLTLYILINVLSALHSLQIDAMLEAIGRVYLVIMFLVFVTFLREEGDHILNRLMNYWIKGALLMAAITLAGYIWALVGGGINECVRIYENYPYLGTVIRAAGLTGGSGMLVIVLMMPALWCWYKFRYEKKFAVELVLLLIVLFLTLSKELVLLVIGMVLLDPLSQYLYFWQRAILLLFAALLFVIGTHWIIQSKQNIQSSYLGSTQYTPGKVSFYIGSYQLVASTYVELKKANWYIGWQHPWLGVGPGLFNQTLSMLKEKGQYAKHLPNYDPHFTWGGAWSETGVLGLLSLIYLWGSAAVIWLQNRTFPYPILQVATVFLLLILIISTSMDVMNFRQLWLAAAIGASINNPQKG